jgi:phosphate-selective porin OprO/OprP
MKVSWLSCAAYKHPVVRSAGLASILTTLLLPTIAIASPPSDPDAIVPIVPAPAPERAPAPTLPPPSPPDQAEGPVAPDVEAEPEPKPEPTLKGVEPGEESDISRARYTIGKGLAVESKNGRYSLQLRGRAQLRYDLEHPNEEGESTEHLLQVRRLRLQFRGHVFSKHVKYYLQFGFSIQDMSSGLPSEPAIRRNPVRDARVDFDRFRDFTVSVGQFKVPFSRQRVNSSAQLNMVDRTSTNAEFSLDRDLGIQASSKDIGGLGKLAYYVGVFMGEGRNAYEFSDPGMLYVGRFEVLPFGQFDDYGEGDLIRTKKPGLSLAAAYAFQDRAHPARGVLGEPPADGGTTNFHHVTADVLFKWHGVSLNTAFHLRRGFARRNGGALDDMGMPIPTVPARQGIAWFGQLGWVVPKIPLEFVGRYGLIRNIYGDASSLPDSDEAGAGINWYFVGHDLKLQVDYFRLWDASMGTSLAEQARNGTDRVRVQFQVFF